jgi:hypothetical protein
MTTYRQHKGWTRHWRGSVLLGLTAAALAACSSVPPTLDVIQLAAAGAGTLQVVGTLAAERETQAATALWPTDTATPTQTPTSPHTPTATATDTSTPTPLPSGTVVADGALRAGPGAVYPMVVALTTGATARPVGLTADGEWVLVVLDQGEEGWLLTANFSFDSNPSALPIITDIPATPTRPPATFTPTVPPPTATYTPSPYTCDFTVSRDPGGRPNYVLLVGSGWPHSAPINVTFTKTFAGETTTTTGINVFGTGDADDQIPGGFWQLHYSGPGTFTLSTWACSRTVTGP